MKRHPIGPLVDALRANSSEIDHLKSQVYLLLSVAHAVLKGSRIQLAARISSQHISSILLCAPHASEPVVLELVGGQVIFSHTSTCHRNDENLWNRGCPQDRSTNWEATRHLRNSAGRLREPTRIQYRVRRQQRDLSPCHRREYCTTCTVSNFGFMSLQGGTRFAKDVLELMGCKAVQTGGNRHWSSDWTVNGSRICRCGTNDGCLLDFFRVGCGCNQLDGSWAMPQRSQRGFLELRTKGLRNVIGFGL